MTVSLANPRGLSWALTTPCGAAFIARHFLSRDHALAYAAERMWLVVPRDPR